MGNKLIKKREFSLEPSKKEIIPRLDKVFAPIETSRRVWTSYGVAIHYFAFLEAGE